MHPRYPIYSADKLPEYELLSNRSFNTMFFEVGQVWNFKTYQGSDIFIFIRKIERLGNHNRIFHFRQYEKDAQGRWTFQVRAQPYDDCRKWLDGFKEIGYAVNRTTVTLPDGSTTVIVERVR